MDHWKKIGSFDSVCDWPGRYNNAGDFTGKLNVRDLPQFKTDAYLAVECQAQSVTYAATAPSKGCQDTAVDTVANNSITKPTFQFGNFYETQPTFIFGATGVAFVAVHKIFLQGANPALDFAMAGLD